MPQSRQLAAIMFTDIVGYTALMGNDEQKAFAFINQNRQIQKPIIEQYNGQWIKEMGDGAMASFQTASEAVHAAIKIQQACNELGTFKVKIGIHLGEVVFENGDIFGDGVNIASRIEALGIGGCILVSKSVRDQIKNNDEICLQPLGIFSLKNVKESIEVFAVSNPGIIIPESGVMKGKVRIDKKKKLIGYLIPAIIIAILLGKIFIKGDTEKPIKLLAIFPFENTQKDSSLFFLSDGISENLINRISSFANVKVFARSATFGLADSLRNVPGARKLLNADMVLTGQLQKRGQSYLLNCQLIDAENQSQIWGDRYELSNTDVSDVEDAIIASLMNPLKIQLVANAQPSEAKHKVVPEAYAEYLKGRYLSYGSTQEESENALDHFRKAIQLDPKYALAYASIANEKIVQGLFATASRKEIVNEARLSLEAAKGLNPDLADIYSAEGALKFYYDWDWEGAVRSYKKALELDPGNATIYIRYSATLGAIGRFDESLALADKAVALDPISISSLHNLGWVNLLAGDYEKSEEAFGKALELHPTWVWGHIKKGMAHGLQKECDQATFHEDQAEEMLTDGWGSELIQTVLISIYLNCGDQEKATKLIERFLTNSEVNLKENSYSLSRVYYLKGDYNKALEWEKICVEENSLEAYYMNLPIFYTKEFFESPGHQEVLRSMGFGD